MESQALKVGELAARTGLSVRALHHYDEIGLLSPSRRTAAGHRLYTGGDVARLLRIRSLQQLGFPLDQIRACLDDDRFSPLEVLSMHCTRLKERLQETEQLCRRLEALRDRLAQQQDVSVGEFLQAIEELTMFEKCYTKEQLDQLARRRDELGEETIRAAETEWPKLIAAVRAEMDKGTPPDDPVVQALAKRWNELIEMFTGGDEGIRQSLGNLYRGEPGLAGQQGIDPGIGGYVQQALGR